jgi:hypothetical protein
MNRICVPRSPIAVRIRGADTHLFTKLEPNARMSRSLGRAALYGDARPVTSNATGVTVGVGVQSCAQFESSVSF